ncbi:uncharacterized protein LOC101235846 isoform X4 [Hydra vulgaris]|uniref:Uncharacterized protein LOC101235846 isoform X4 n=1 Tax=Hydra vulgaris TaxID=6087 RepID=A0ABM4DIZ0_HYDVU
MINAYTVLLLCLVSTTFIWTAIISDDDLRDNDDLKKDIVYEIDKQIDDDIFDESLEDDQQSTDAKFMEEHIGKIYSIESHEYSYYRLGSNGASIGLHPSGVEKFKVVKGLNGRPDSISLQSVKETNKYIAQQNFVIQLLPLEVNSNQFKNSSSFIIRNDKYFTGYFALESSGYPGYFLHSQWYYYGAKLVKSTSKLEYFQSFRFVQLGNTHIGKCYSFQSKNFPNYYIGVGHDDVVTIRLHSMDGFCIVKPLNGQSDAVSLQLVKDSSQYLRLQDNVLKQHSIDIFSASFKNEASFLLRDNYYYPGYASFESTYSHKLYLGHQSDTIKLLREEPFAELYKKDTSFKLVQLENLRIGKEYLIQCNDLPQYRIGVRNHETAAIVFKSLDEFRVVKALNGQSQFVSLQSVNDKDKYLRALGFGLKLQSIDFTSEHFNGDASFNLLESYYYPGYVSFESANNPGYFLRHEHFTVKLLKEEPHNEKYRRAASFKLVRSSVNPSRSILKLVLKMNLKKKLRDRFHSNKV